MTREAALKLKRGDDLLVYGSVRKTTAEVDESGKWIEVQFRGYSLNVLVDDVVPIESRTK
jgi:hypothetical protein